MARIVKLTDQTPLIIKDTDLRNGSCAVCRCGLSGAWPMCDGTHKGTVGEQPGKLYRYEREMPQGTVRREEVGSFEEFPQAAQSKQHEDPGASRGARPPTARSPQRESPGTDAAATAGEASATGEGAEAGGGQDELLQSPARDRIKVTESESDAPSRAI